VFVKSTIQICGRPASKSRNSLLETIRRRFHSVHDRFVGGIRVRRDSRDTFAGHFGHDY
jgi:hypothetical protein